MKNNKLKKLLLEIWFHVHDEYQLRMLRKKYAVSIMNSEDTIAYIKKHHCSIARYGDGEFGLMLKTGAEGYQEISEDLSKALKDVFRKASSEVLICIPYPMASTRECRRGGKQFWKRWALEQQEAVVSEIRRLMDGKKYVFGDSFVSRPYTGFELKSKAERTFQQLKELWKDRDVLIVEGAGTRMGVGNDLFDEAKSVKRILAPAENAFRAYDAIKDSILTHWNGELVIMALGPTATILAVDLSQEGIQALDMGHLDIQYEWFLTGTAYQPVANKYVNEVTGANTFQASDDQRYLSQIVAQVDN